LNHRDARILLSEAFRRRFEREPTRPEAQCLQAVALIETNYGQGWKPPGNGSNNFGAIQAGTSWTGATFQYTDTRPNADGTSTPYVTKFRKYPSPIAGAEDLVRVVYQVQPRGRMSREITVLPAATSGDSRKFSRALYETGYYEGFGPTPEDRINNHHRQIERALKTIAKALGEPMPDGEDRPPTIPPEPQPLLTAEDKVRAIAAQVDVVGTLRVEAMREMAGIDTQRPTEIDPNEGGEEA
jgi:hypothetical protein